MDQGPLVIEEIDAGAELIREFNKYAPVSVAFWLKATDDDRRYLYIASDQITDDNFDLAYGEVLRIVQNITSVYIYLDPFRVKIVSTDDPLAQAALEIIQRFPGRLATQYGGRFFGGMTVDGVYIYPPLSPAAVP